MSRLQGLHNSHARNRSGCVGVYLHRAVRQLSGDRAVRRSWWIAQCGPGRRARFSVDMMGEREAFREAVRARAAWVRERVPAVRAHVRANRRRLSREYRARHAARLEREARENRLRLNAERKARYHRRRGVAAAVTVTRKEVAL